MHGVGIRGYSKHQPNDRNWRSGIPFFPSNRGICYGHGWDSTESSRHFSPLYERFHSPDRIHFFGLSYHSLLVGLPGRKPYLRLGHSAAPVRIAAFTYVSSAGLSTGAELARSAAAYPKRESIFELIVVQSGYKLAHAWLICSGVMHVKKQTWE